MVIYEVNLSINHEVYTDFLAWLKHHIKETLALPGFIQASLLKEDVDASNQEKLTVQYQLENKHDLNRYFDEFAPKMREEGIKLFQDKFSAERRVFDVAETIQKNFGV